MQKKYPNGQWHQLRSRKPHHWGILTLDDLDKANLQHSQLKSQLLAQYQAAKEQGADKPKPIAADFSI